MQSRAIRSLVISLALVGATGCGDEAKTAAPRWIDLARGFEPVDLLDVAGSWPSERTGGATTRAMRDADGIVWIETAIARDEWRPDEYGREGAWFTDRPWSGGFGLAGNGALRLEGGGRVFERRPGHKQRLVPGLCYIDEERIYITIEPDAEPPAETIFALSADQGESVDGVWRVQTLDHVGAGIPVHPGHTEEVRVSIPPACALRFRTVFERLPFGLEPRMKGEPTTATFRVRLDGDVLFEEEGLGLSAPHAIALPIDGVTDARLTFEVEAAGDDVGGLGVFYTPVIGPSDVGDYRARPWDGERPDIVLFIADTFRADNMAIHGGREDLAPHLNRFAADSLRFLQARSTAAWTLPSISSMMTGLFPPQHGATKHELTVAPSITTIAEELAAAGYRTAAVTDSGYFSPPFGLDQGFDLFVENRIRMWHLTKTIDQALEIIDHDDGRPLFLVVHTYRVHGPFREGPEENQEVFDAFLERCKASISMAGQHVEERRLMPYLDEWVGMYERGVIDMDAKFERFRRELDERGFFESGVLAFTGDHGQAHGENDDIAHGGKLWETKLRVPLLLHGNGIAPGDVLAPVSHVDWAPTFGALAGIPPHADWIGTSLLTPSADRPTFAFRIEKEDEVTIQSGAHKISALPDPEALRRGVIAEAFDLSSDPGELENLRESEWAKELARQSADAVEFFLRAKADAMDSETDADLAERLAEIGYGGE